MPKCRGGRCSRIEVSEVKVTVSAVLEHTNDLSGKVIHISYLDTYGGIVCCLRKYKVERLGLVCFFVFDVGAWKMQRGLLRR